MLPVKFAKFHIVPPYRSIILPGTLKLNAIALTDDTYTDAPCMEYDKLTNEWLLSFSPCLQAYPTGNHPAGANVLFYDGHVGFFPYARKLVVFRRD
jgi:prepilin-type processing-associated H-X9-DG protein